MKSKIKLRTINQEYLRIHRCINESQYTIFVSSLTCDILVTMKQGKI